jgi:tetratricopeptide (TPR) repeat protein
MEERAYIDALARDFSLLAGSDRAGLDRDYARAMKSLSRQYAGDPDANVLYAMALMQIRPWNLWKTDGSPAPGTEEIVSVLKSTLARWPDHVGANHFYIHLMEGPPFPEEALESAHRLETLVPLAGHLVHMPSHIYFRIGDYARAAHSNIMAIDAGRRYSEESPGGGGPSSYDVHNLYFLYFSSMMDGDFGTAYDAATEAQASAPPSAEQFWVTPTLSLLRFGYWARVLQVPPPEDNMFGARLFWHYARGCAFANSGVLKRAREERVAMEEIYKQIRPGAAFGMFFNDWSILNAAALHALDARIAAAQGDAEEAIRHWRSAVSIQDQMNFDDLPDWYYPLRESLGAELFRVGRLTEAEQVFRDDLGRTPHNPRSLFGLWKTLEAEGRVPAAKLARRQFGSAWKGVTGDPRLEDF